MVTYNIQVAISPQYGGSVQVSKNGNLIATLQNTSTVQFDSSDIGSFYAVPTSGKKFVNWTGTGGSSPNNPLTISSFNTSGNLQANFASTVPVTHDPVKIQILKTGEGFISPYDIGFYSFTYGSFLSLTANPSVHWQFDHWEGPGGVSKDNPNTFTNLTADGSIKAVFIEMTDDPPLLYGVTLDGSIYDIINGLAYGIKSMTAFSYYGFNTADIQWHNTYPDQAGYTLYQNSRTNTYLNGINPLPGGNPPPHNGNVTNIIAQIQRIEVLSSDGSKSYGIPYPENQPIGIPANSRIEVQLTFENFGDDAYFSFFTQTQSDEAIPPGAIIQTPWNLVRTGGIFTHTHWLNFGQFGAEVRCWLKGSTSPDGSSYQDADTEQTFHISTATAANITVKINPPGSGTVQVTDAREGYTLGIVTSDQQFNFLSTDQIQFQATANTGWNFADWSGPEQAYSATNPVVISNMSGTGYVQANFTQPVVKGTEGMLKLYYVKFPWFNRDGLNSEAQAGGSILGVINPILNALGWEYERTALQSDIIGDYVGLTFRATGTDPITIGVILLIIAGLVTIALVLGAYFVRCIWIPLTTGQTVEQIAAKQQFEQTKLEQLSSGKITQAQYDDIDNQYTKITGTPPSGGLPSWLLPVALVGGLFLLGRGESKSKENKK